MSLEEELDRSRRRFVRMLLALPGLGLAACQGEASSPTAPTSAVAGTGLQATPACSDDDDMTVAQTEGPYFKPSSPERISLFEPGITGTRLMIAGQVLSTGCAPVSRALLDFWQADDAGVYDLAGYRLRGHQFSDDSGRFQVETIVPGLYPGRTRHVHVNVQAPNGPVLTTQLYFPGEPRNAADGIFSPRLLMSVQEAGGVFQATFNFVVRV
jgi:protocatechuate 3,4-dioxygenase beta subunit